MNKDFTGSLKIQNFIIEIYTSDKNLQKKFKLEKNVERDLKIQVLFFDPPIFNSFYQSS